ncbi:Inositol oxygenase [Geodia barretti]|uniref:Inositol oxygenase n=1 Tax=Geodia barretti TaxID=519541 RepID=A0AA35SZX7_GEOBA|nr:Inositol oxygenase [Geodia barretti]
MGGELLAAVAAGEAKIARQNAASGKPAGDGTSPACTERVSWPVEDPSEFRPELAPGGPLEDLGKQKDDFRVYYEESGERFDIVRKTYAEMHKNQTMQFGREMRAKYSGGKAKMTMMEAIFALNNLIDESDPDTSEPNSFHLFQTAERIRQVHPDKDWFQLTGLIHDVGKLLALWGEPQWAAVGDTFPVGCAFAKECVFPEQFQENPDFSHPVYSTKYGIYQPNCGLNNVMMSFGHDEYLYQALVRNGATLPPAALYIIRFHSFYPWHTAKAYNHLCSEEDLNQLPWVLEFNKFDLYSKADVEPDVDALVPYYQTLIDKYCPGILDW